MEEPAQHGKPLLTQAHAALHTLHSLGPLSVCHSDNPCRQSTLKSSLSTKQLSQLYRHTESKQAVTPKLGLWSPHTPRQGSGECFPSRTTEWGASTPCSLLPTAQPQPHRSQATSFRRSFRKVSKNSSLFPFPFCLPFTPRAQICISAYARVCESPEGRPEQRSSSFSAIHIDWT